MVLAAALLAWPGCGAEPFRRAEERLTGTVRWVKPGASPAQFEEDRSACLTEAARAPEGRDQEARYDACLESRGYARE